jgi:hypothetical protein
MRRVWLICTLMLITGGPALAGPPSSFEVVMRHYEPIRLALLADSTVGVAAHGTAIVTELESLRTDFEHERVGASTEVIPVVEEKLEGMIAAARSLAAAASLEAARDAFYELSVPLVRWQEGVAEGRRPFVAYCSMYKRSWLQPDEEIGNPYGGMPRCGTIVSR